jgi:hypothetical protein
MYYTECELLAERHPDLAEAIERIDQALSQMDSAEVIRGDELASFLGLDPNQTSAVLDGLAEAGVLRAEEMVECAHPDCGMSVLRSDYEEAVEEEDEYRCTSCDRPFTDTAIRSITTYRRGERWKEAARGAGDAAGPEITVRPDPKRHTTAKVWTTKDGSLWMSTKTNGRADGKVHFPLNDNGSPTYQMQFMRLICFRHPKPVLLKDVMREVYPEEFAMIGRSPNGAKNLLRKVRSLVSDVRTKKFAKAGLNPDILPPLSFESSVETGISLQLAKLHRLDDKAVDGEEPPLK